MEVPCFSGGCLNATLVCDGKADCPEGDDELLCAGIKRCRIDEFRYMSNNALPFNMVSMM